MKKTFFKSILCASLFVGAFTSCNEVEDLYNPELARERAQEAFGLPIDPNHDWNMTSVVTANVTLNEDALSDYSFRIYTADPLDKNSGATILADYPVKTDAQGKASASFKFEMPSYLTQVYIGRVDNHGRRLVGIANIENNTISKSFGVASAATRAGEDPNPLYTINNDDLYSVEDVTALLASAKVLGQNGNNDLTGVTKVQGTFDGSNLNYEIQNVSKYKTNILIIDNGATLNITQSKQLQGLDIIVASGGTLNISNEFKFNPYARIIVMYGGVVNHTQAGSNGRSFNFQYGGTNCIYNAGTINMNDGTTYLSNGAVIYNASGGIINANIISCNNNNDIICNYGKIDAVKITCGNDNSEHGTLHNGCLIRCGHIRVKAINLAESATLEDLDYLYTENINFRRNSIVRVNTTGTFESKNNLTFNYFSDTSENSDPIEDGALFSAGKMLLSNASITVNNKNYIFIERNEVVSNNDKTDKYFSELLTNAAGTVGKVGEAPLVIITDQTDVKDPSIETATCAGKGNKPNNYVPREEPAIFTYAFEDTDKGAGDYDFNDVVIKCSAPIDNNITVTLVAVGAQKRINLMFQLRDNDGNVIPGTTRNVFEEEVHAAFPNGATENFINTLVGNPTFEYPSVEIEVPEGFSYSKHGDFFINVVKSSATSHLPQFTDNFIEVPIPYAILVPVDWRYPQEWQRVNTAYDKFKNWAADVTKDIDWYTTPTDASKVY